MPAKFIITANLSDPLAKVLAAHLERVDCRLVNIPEGTDILWRCEIDPPDLVILTDSLCDMSAANCCTYLRDIPQCADVPVLFLAEGDSPKESSVQLMDADYFLQGPIGPSELLEFLAGILLSDKASKANRPPEFPTRVTWPTHQTYASSRGPV